MAHLDLASESLIFMFHPTKSFIALAFALILMTLANPAEATVISAHYLDETVLVFKPARLAADEIPASILVSAGPITFATEIKLACKWVHTRSEDLLVYLPGSRICLSLTELFILAWENHPDQAHHAITEQDRKKLNKSLETKALVVMQANFIARSSALVDGVAAAQVCYCPNGPELIFDNGFETTL